MPAGYAALLYVTSVLFGAFASAWMKEETLTPVKMLGCLAGFVGAALVVQLGPVEPSLTLVVAVLTAILGSALSGASTPLIKRAITRMEPLAITAGMHVISFIYKHWLSCILKEKFVFWVFSTWIGHVTKVLIAEKSIKEHVINLNK